MHYRLYVRWSTLSRDPFKAEGIVEVHVFNNGESFGSIHSWVAKHEFAVEVSRYCRSYRGVNGGLVPKLLPEVMERLGILVDSYFKGFEGDDHACCRFVTEPGEPGYLNILDVPNKNVIGSIAGGYQREAQIMVDALNRAIRNG